LGILKISHLIPNDKMAFHRWLYREGHPNRLAKILNRGWALVYSLGISPNYLVTLELIGRKSGKMTSFPLVLTIVNGKRYLVSMLGEEANWARNVRAAGRKARLRHGMSEQVLLKEGAVSQRAPIEGLFTACARSVPACRHQQRYASLRV
jgi:hypothetical protein